MIEKDQQRQEAYKARNTQADKDRLSEVICNQFVSHEAYLKADTVMWYLHCRSEVRTIEALKKEFKGIKKIVIPYCTKDEYQQPKLGLWLLDDLSELVPGMWGILEPPAGRWNDEAKMVLPEELDYVMVPGVAFDRKGSRLGNGAGYYDRLLQSVRTDAVLTGICFESQICEHVIMDDHDIVMDNVLTEKGRYGCKI